SVRPAGRARSRIVIDSGHAPGVLILGSAPARRGHVPSLIASKLSLPLTWKPHIAGAGRRFGTLVGLAGLCLLLWALTPYFLTVANLLNVMEQTAINAIVAVGMTYVIIAGGIDLSVGSLLACAGVVLAWALKAGWPMSVSIALAVAVGAA